MQTPTRTEEELTKSIKKHSIIMVDDDASVLTSFGVFFKKTGYDFIPVQDPHKFLKLIKARKPDVIIMDIKLGDISGVALIKAFRKVGLMTPIFVVSGFIDKKLIMSLRECQVSGFIMKPASLRELSLRIQTALRKPTHPQIKHDTKKPDYKKMWPPVSALIVTANNSLVEHPDFLIPAAVIEEFNLRIFARREIQESITMMKNPDRNIKLLVIDAANERQVLGVLRLIKIIDSNLKIPVFFFSETPSSKLRNKLTEFGFVHLLSRSSVLTKETAAKFRNAIDAGANRTSDRSTMRVQNIMKKLSSVKSLPPMPDIYLKIEALSHDTTATSKDYADILELDPSITARLLRMSNSAFYSFKRKIKTVKDTVTLMGTREILSLVRLACITNNLKAKPEVESAVRKVWEHSAACAITAQLLYEKTDLVKTKDMNEELFICGVIHDIGKIVLWNVFPEIYMSFQLNPSVSDYPTAKEEEDLMGASHADIGRALADHWNLPEPLRDVISFHHKPTVRPDSERVMMIHFADIIADIITGRLPEGVKPEFSPQMLEASGYTDENLLEIAFSNATKIKDDIVTVTKMITG